MEQSNPIGKGIQSDSNSEAFRSDLLIDKKDRDRARPLYPNVYHALDYAERWSDLVASV